MNRYPTAPPDAPLRPQPRPHALARRVLAAAGGALALALAFAASPAHAVPSYARQTGMDCAGCHIGAFGPQLTAAGIRFKLGGYLDSDGKDGKVPLSGMVAASWSRTRQDQNPPPDALKANDNATLDEASLFIAGKLMDHVGAFVQVTRDGIAHSNALDQTDIRVTNTMTIAGKDTVVGLTFNNNPGVQDAFNSTPVWSYPYIGSPAGFGTGDAATLIDGGLEGRVVGASAYAFWNDALYAELGTYRSLAPQAQFKLGAGRDFQQLDGNAYWRLGWMQDRKRDMWHAGVFGWSARLAPDRTVPGRVDGYRDIGLDAGYQYLGTREHIATLDATLVTEQSHIGATGERAHLHTARIAAGYSWRETFGASTAWFSSGGSDPAATSRGAVLQADWTPWGKEAAEAPAPFSLLNLRLGVQYWKYGTFGGTSAGAAAHDTLFLSAWSAF